MSYGCGHHGHGMIPMISELTGTLLGHLMVTSWAPGCGQYIQLSHIYSQK